MFGTSPLPFLQQLFTELPLDKIEELGKLEGADINQAKVILADEATKWVYNAHVIFYACLVLNIEDVLSY